MRDKNEGVPIAAIAASETVSTRKSGSVKTNQTRRAIAFAPPAPPSFDWWGVNGRHVALAAFVAVLAMSAPLLQMAGAGDESASPVVATAVFEMFAVALPFLAIASFIPLALSASGNTSAARDEEDRVAAEERIYAAMIQVHQRLRYVEAEHVVFDPETGTDAPAERRDILRMTRELARQEGEGSATT